MKKGVKITELLYSMADKSYKHGHLCCQFRMFIGLRYVFTCVPAP